MDVIAALSLVICEYSFLLALWKALRFEAYSLVKISAVSVNDPQRVAVTNGATEE